MQYVCNYRCNRDKTAVFVWDDWEGDYWFLINRVEPALLRMFSSAPVQQSGSGRFYHCSSYHYHLLMKAPQGSCNV